MLNSVFNHVDLSWIISSNKQMKYETEENNPDWLNKGPWYNTAICSKLYETVFGYFIRNALTDRYNLMCSINEHDRQQPTYFYDAITAGGREITKNTTTAALKSLGATFNFIDSWLKHYQHNYQEILEMHHESIIELFKQITTMKPKPLSQDKKLQLLLTDIYSAWYTEK